MLLCRYLQHTSSPFQDTFNMVGTIIGTKSPDQSHNIHNIQPYDQPTPTTHVLHCSPRFNQFQPKRKKKFINRRRDRMIQYDWSIPADSSRIRNRTQEAHMGWLCNVARQENPWRLFCTALHRAPDLPISLPTRFPGSLGATVLWTLCLRKLLRKWHHCAPLGVVRRSGTAVLVKCIYMTRTYTDIQIKVARQHGPLKPACIWKSLPRKKKST